MLMKRPVTSQVGEYLEYCEFRRRFTPATIQTKRQHIQKFLREHPKLTDMRKLTNKQLDAWLNSLLKEGKTGKTVNNNGDQVLALLRYLRDIRGEKISLQFEAVERCEEDEANTPHFSDEDIQRIKAACHGPRELVLISLIFESGLRISEVSKLRCENIEGRQINLVGKGRKGRVDFVTEETRQLLERWILIAGTSDGYIFPSPMKFGAPLGVVQIRSSINAPIRRAGFEKGSAHAVRRGAITDWLNKGISLQDATKLAGHTSPDTTLKHYYKVMKKQLGERYAQAMEGNNA